MFSCGERQLIFYLKAVAEAVFDSGVHVLPFDELHERHMSAAFSRRDRPPIL